MKKDEIRKKIIEASEKSYLISEMAEIAANSIFETDDIKQKIFNFKNQMEASWKSNSSDPNTGEWLRLFKNEFKDYL